MSDYAYLTRTRFETDAGDVDWGWRIGNDGIEVYVDHFSEAEVPVDPLELFAFVLINSRTVINDMFWSMYTYGEDITINGSWFDHDQIRGALAQALGMEESDNAEHELP